MAKDFFVDVEPQPEPDRPVRPPAAASAASVAPGERSIRNISVPARRIPVTPQKNMADIQRPEKNVNMAPHPRRSRFMIWLVAGLAIAGLVGAAAYLTMFSKTEVSVTPRTHQVTFDESTQFTAYPA